MSLLLVDHSLVIGYPHSQTFPILLEATKHWRREDLRE